MVMLGDVLAEARRSSGTFQTWLQTNMPELMADIEVAAARSGENSAEFVRGSLAAFSQIAAEEDWANLTSRLRDSADPGTACLLTMVQWRMSEERRIMDAAALAGGGSENDAGS